MKAVVNGVISLYVPAVVVLIHAVAVNPDDGRMFFDRIQIFWNKQPARHQLAIRSREMHKLGLDESRFVDTGRHGVGETNRLRVWFCFDREQVRTVARIRVLVDDVFIIGGPMRFDVGAVA